MDIGEGYRRAGDFAIGGTGVPPPSMGTLKRELRTHFPSSVGNEEDGRSTGNAAPCRIPVVNSARRGRRSRAEGAFDCIGGFAGAKTFAPRSRQRPPARVLARRDKRINCRHHAICVNPRCIFDKMYSSSFPGSFVMGKTPTVHNSQIQRKRMAYLACGSMLAMISSRVRVFTPCDAPGAESNGPVATGDGCVRTVLGH